MFNLWVVVMALVVAVVVAFLLGRYAFRVGVVLFLLGVGPMAALYVYGKYFQRMGGPSDGMFYLLSMAALLLFTPFGLILIAIGALRGD